MTRIFGIKVQANRPVPTFGDLSDDPSPDVRIDLTPRAEKTGGGPVFQELHHRSPPGASDGPPAVEVHRLSDGGFHFRYADETEFTVGRDGRLLRASWPSTSTLEETATYLAPILGFVLRLLGVTCLHASAAAVGGRAVALVGEAGTGKSTTIAALARKGLPVLTDDLLALSEEQGRFLVQPGLPRVLLWPDSAEALWDAPDALPRLLPTWEKRYLDLKGPGYSYCDRPLPLAAIYVLGERDPKVAVPIIEPVSGTDAMIRLVANTYANRLLDNAMKAAELKVLARLVNQVPVMLTRAPDDRGRIPEFCEAILHAFERIGG